MRTPARPVHPAPEPVPVTVLTGFLGAGKTTLLNQLLRHPALVDTAVLINEFGEIGLDHLLVERLDGDTVLLNAGCLCCTVRGDLVKALRDLAVRIEQGHAIRRVVVETTGLADPAPILQTLMSDPLVLYRYRLDGVVTLVDAATGMATLDAQAEAVKQAAVADRLVLTKTDLATAEQFAPGRGCGALNPGAPLLNALHGDIEPEALLDCGLYDATRKHPDVRRWLDAEAWQAHDHHHGHHHHDRQPPRCPHPQLLPDLRRAAALGRPGHLAGGADHDPRRERAADQGHPEPRGRGPPRRHPWRAAPVPPAGEAGGLAGGRSALPPGLHPARPRPRDVREGLRAFNDAASPG